MCDESDDGSPVRARQAGEDRGALRQLRLEPERTQLVEEETRQLQLLLRARPLRHAVGALRVDPDVAEEPLEHIGCELLGERAREGSSSQVVRGACTSRARPRPRGRGSPRGTSRSASAHCSRGSRCPSRSSECLARRGSRRPAPTRRPVRAATSGRKPARTPRARARARAHQGRRALVPPTTGASRRCRLLPAPPRGEGVRTRRSRRPRSAPARS